MTQLTEQQWKQGRELYEEFCAQLADTADETVTTEWPYLSVAWKQAWAGTASVFYVGMSPDERPYTPTRSAAEAAQSVDDCTHGEFCPIHPQATGLHNFDPNCGRRDLHSPHTYSIMSLGQQTDDNHCSGGLR